MHGVLLVCDVCDDPVDYEATVVEVETGKAITVGSARGSSTCSTLRSSSSETGLT